MAVVSWPAASKVISWSRSSRSVICRPSSSAARTSMASTSVRCGQIGVGAAVGDLGVEQPVGVLDPVGAGSATAAVAAGRDWRCQGGPRPGAQQPRHDVAQRGQPGRVGGADDRPQDHLQGDLRPSSAPRELHAHRPAGDVVGGGLGHHRGSGAPPRRAGRAATSGGGGRGGRRRRSAGPSVGPSRPVSIELASPGMVNRRIAGEDGLDVARVGQVDDGADRCDPQREHAPVAAMAGGENRGQYRSTRRFGQRGQRGSRRQRLHGSTIRKRQYAAFYVCSPRKPISRPHLGR